MTDTFSIMDLANLITDISLIGSFIFLAYQVLMERKDLRYNTYEKLMSDFTTTSLFLAEHPNIARYVTGEVILNKNEEDEKSAYFYLDAILSLCERVWHSKQTVEWAHWENWLRGMAKSELFQELVKDSVKSYDKEFVAVLQKLVDSHKNAKTS